MKINEIIKERRLQQGLTQEQIADYLGVSAPAVNKWEKGTTYPDITLLPALARLLGTDLNTLLSFKEDLTDREISCISNEITQVAANGDLAQAFDMAREKLHEYPSCDQLIISMAVLMEGLSILYSDNRQDSDHTKEIMALYERAAKSSNLTVKNQAQSMLVSKYMKLADYDKAALLLEELPDEPQMNKKQLQASLHIYKNELDAAAKITQQRLMTETSAVLSALYTLIGIAVKKGDTANAMHIADVARDFTELFDLWDYSAHVGYLDIYTAQKDTAKCMETLEKLLVSAFKPWAFDRSPLYSHIEKKNNDSANTIGEAIVPRIIKDLEDTDAHEYDFLRNAPEFPQFMSQLKGRLERIPSK